MRNSLALARVFGAVAGVKEAAADRDKGVIIVAGACQCLFLFATERLLPLQHSVAVTVDDLNRVGVRDTDMVWLYPDHLPVSFMRVVHSQVAFSPTSLEKQP